MIPDDPTKLQCFRRITRTAFATVSVLPLVASAVAAGESKESWFRRSLVGLEVGPTGAQFGHSGPNDRGYCAHFDGREIVRQTVAAHGEYLVLWVRDGDYAYYDSELLPKAPGLGNRDPLRDAVDEARKHDLPLISYCVVQQGGHLLKAHPEWEMRGADGKPLEDATLAELIGATATRRLDSADNWVKLAKSPGLTDDSSAWNGASEDLRSDWPFLVEGPATVYQPTTAQTVGELLAPHRTARQLQGKMGTEWPMSADTPVGPAVLINRVGKGTVLTLAASPDFATASEHAIVEARTLLRNAIRLLHPAPRVEITAPANVEVVVTDAPGQRTLRVHFIAYNATPQTTPSKNRPFTGGCIPSRCRRDSLDEMAIGTRRSFCRRHAQS